MSHSLINANNQVCHASEIIPTENYFINSLPMQMYSLNLIFTISKLPRFIKIRIGPSDELCFDSNRHYRYGTNGTFCKA